MTNEQAWDQIEYLEDENESLEDEIARNEREIERLRDKFGDRDNPAGAIEPAEPPLPRVMKGHAYGNETWMTDGFAAIKGEWPGPFEENPTSPNMTGIIEAAKQNACEATIAEVVDLRAHGGATILSDGTCFDNARLLPLVQGRQVTFKTRGLNPAALYDEGGELFALLMPLNNI